MSRGNRQSRHLIPCFIVTALSFVSAVSFTASSYGDVVTDSAGMPPNTGVYTTGPSGVAHYFIFGQFGPILASLEDITIQPQFDGPDNPVTTSFDGGNETVSFSATATGNFFLTDSGPMPFVASGQMSMAFYGRGSDAQLGTFATQVIAMDFVGTLGSGPAELKLDPFLVGIGTGSTTITDPPADQFQISSFFDVFTELSLDGGNSFVPQGPPAAHFTLESTDSALSTPEPASAVSLVGLIAAAGLIFSATRRRNAAVS